MPGGKFILPTSPGLFSPGLVGSLYFHPVQDNLVLDWVEVYTSHQSRVILDCIVYTVEDHFIIKT
jgi:hypothetical protein